MAAFSKTFSSTFSLSKRKSTQVVGEIQLLTGWNYDVAYLGTIAKDALVVVQPLIDSNNLIKVLDIYGNFVEDWTEYGLGWQNNIGNFEPGGIYSFNVNADCTLVFA